MAVVPLRPGRRSGFKGGFPHFAGQRDCFDSLLEEACGFPSTTELFTRNMFAPTVTPESTRPVIVALRL